MKKIEIKKIIEDFMPYIMDCKNIYVKEMDDNEFRNALIIIVRKIIEGYNEETHDYEEYFKESIKEEFKKLKNNSKSLKEAKLYELISKITISSKLNTCKMTLNMIGEYIENNNTGYLIEDYTRLLKNQKINELLSNIIQLVLSSSLKDKISLLEHGINNTISLDLLYLYLSENDIELDDDSIIYTNDIVKDYLNELKSKPKKYAVLSRSEEQELFTRYRNGETELRKVIIEHNLRLVVSISKRYVNKGLELEDIIQEGNIGLFTAIDRFDISYSNKFSTYATWWIRQSILRAITNKGKLIRIPVHRVEQITKYKQVYNTYLASTGEYPTDKEMRKILGWSEATYEDVKKSIINTVSLDEPTINDEEDATLKDLIASDETPIADSVSSDLLVNAVRLSIENALTLGVLNENEYFVLKKRYGLYEEEVETLEKIGLQMNITRERVRQLQKSAEKKLLKAILYCPEFIFNKRTFSEKDIQKAKQIIKKKKLEDIYERLEYIKEKYCLFENIDINELVLKLG